MKKQYAAGLLAFSILCSGCGAKNTSAPMDTEELFSVTETEDTTEALPIEETENVLSVTDENYGISITELTESASFPASDDASVCVLEASASYPDVAITDQPALSDKINSAIQAELDTYWAFEKENVTYATEEYRMSLDDPDYTFETYTAQFSYDVKRCDDKIISIVFHQYDYSGGAHGNSWSYGVTFDAATGDRLHLEALSSDYATFHQMLLTTLNAQASLPAYENFIFDDFATDIESSLLKDSAAWYFDRSGLSFISNPYVLGSYAAGTFELNIPYEDLEGLKESYAYDGAYICKLFPGVSVSRDINNDGTTDEICYSISAEEYFSNPTLLLTVNGKVYSAKFDDLHMTYPWTGAYYLIDVDSEDDYIEVAVSNENFDNEKGTCTHFFRYTSSNELIYQGNTPGVFSEDMQVRYNGNGNLVLCDRNGKPVQ